MRRTLLITAALALSALAFSGCSAGTSGASDSSGSQDYSVGYSDGMPPVVEEAASAADGAEAASATDSAEAPSDREVITTGYMSVIVESPKESTAEAIRIAESVGGRVDNRFEYAPTDNDGGGSTLTLRIPAAELTTVVDKFTDLGTVQEISTDAVDVTMQSRDLEARIAALDASVNRLLELLTQADNTDTLIKLETAISERQGELDSLKSQKRYLDDQVAMSTLTLNLAATADAPSVQPDNFFDGLNAGWSGLVTFISGLLVALGTVLPWLIFVGIIAAVVLFIVRRFRRSKNRSHTQQPATHAEPIASEPEE